MPLYEYQCGGCGHADTEYQNMSSPHLTECPKCKQPTYNRQVSLPHTDLKEFHTPIEMYSIAMEDPEQIKAFKTRCPDVECSLDEADPMFGVPIARSRKQKLAALGEAGFVENN